VNVVLLLLLIDSVLTCAGAICFRYWATSSLLWQVLVGVCLWNLGTGLWLTMMKLGMPLAKGSLAFSLTNLILGTVAGVALFKERLTPVQWAGVCLSVVAVVLIERGA
jgi:drug/metabolite transporter (DMT)-like permease